MLIKIYLLGQFKLEANGIPLELPSRPAQSLLAYLVLNAGASLRREKLASLLWCDSPEFKARGYLRQALWRIRKTFEKSRVDWGTFLQINEISVTFEPQADIWVDVDQFVLPPEGRQLDEIIADIRLYRGELLPGFYESWVGLERDRLQTTYFQKMNYLLERLIQARRWDETIQWAEQWILQGYAPEPAYRALMTAFARLGNPAMVQATYQRCVEALSRDLNVEPAAETRQLFEQFQATGLEEYDQRPSVEHSALPEGWLVEQEPITSGQPYVVARERQLGWLNNHLKLAISGQGRVVYVTGEAGSGKTTLLQEFTRRAQRETSELIVASGNCNAHTGIGDPYLPFREILALLSGDVRARWSAGAVTKKYAQFLWNLIPITVQALIEIGPDLIDTFVPGEAVLERARQYGCGQADWLAQLDRRLIRNRQDAGSHDPHQNDLFIQYSQLLARLAQSGPMILVLDDLQWADVGSISLLFHLGRRLAGSRILIVGAYRPEDVSLGRGGERHPLEPAVNELKREFGETEINLDRAEGRVFIDALLDSEPNRLGRRFRELLFRLTRGHPLFTVELLRGMQERGDLLRDEQGRWVVGPDLDWETLPARVEAVIAERVGRLDPSFQKTLRIASVEGEIFTAEIVASVQGLEVSTILSCLSNELGRKHRLVRGDRVQRTGGQLQSNYRFQHILVQKYLYNSLDEAERVHLHERVGTVLESFYVNAPGSTALAPQLARHFEEAQLIHKAIRYLHLAGEMALQMSAYQEAIAQLDRALKLYSNLPEQQFMPELELSLQLANGLAWHLAKGFTPPEMEKAFVRALELCQQVGNTTQYCQILSALSNLNYVRGNYPVARELAAKTLDLANQAGEPDLIVLGHWCLGIICFVQGEFEAARRNLEQIAAYYDPRQHHRPFVILRGVDLGLSGMAYLVCCLWCLGYPDQALTQSRELLRLAREINHAFSLADVLRYGCCEFDKFRRDAQSLNLHARELIAVSKEKGFPAWLAAGEICLGEGLVLQGQYPDGIKMILQGLKENFARDVRCNIPSSLLSLTDAYLKMGDVEAGLAALNDAIEMVEQTDEHSQDAEINRVQAAFAPRLETRPRPRPACCRRWKSPANRAHWAGSCGPGSIWPVCGRSKANPGRLTGCSQAYLPNSQRVSIRQS